jgi:hypothetical protein
MEANTQAATPAPTAAAKAASFFVTRGASYMIDPTKIMRQDGWNSRFDFGELKLLADSIQHELETNPDSGGLVNDIRVERLAKPTEDGKLFRLIDGDRRLSAIESLIKKGVTFPKGIPAKIEDAPTKANTEAQTRDQLVRMYVANTGLQFNPMEEAIHFDKLKQTGMTIKEVAAATGRHVSGVTRASFLLKADKRLRDAVEAKQIGATAAIDIQSAARGDPELLTQLIDEALAAKTKTAKKAVTAKVKQAKVKVAKKEGRKLKMRALSNEQLSQLGAKMSELLMADMKALGLAEDTKLTDWLAACEADVKLGYSFGVLQGLKAAAGFPVDLLSGK